MRKLGRSAIEKIHFNSVERGGGGLSDAQLRRPTVATSSWIIHRSASRNGRVLPRNISITIFLLGANQSLSSNRYGDLVPVARIDPPPPLHCFSRRFRGARFSPFRQMHGSQVGRVCMIIQGNLSGSKMLIFLMKRIEFFFFCFSSRFFGGWD